MSKQLRIAVLLYDGVNAIDVVGPTEALATVRLDDGTCPYAIETWSFENRELRSESGIRLVADRQLPHRRRAHMLLVPGGHGIREPERLAQLSQWLAKHHQRFNHVVSVCTGAYALAASGLMKGHTLTTHWAFADRLARAYPDVRVDAEQLFTRSGKFYSSGGVTSGIDLALDIIAREFGNAQALYVARDLVVFFRRSGHQSQFSTPLKTQISAPSHIEDAMNWAMNHLDKPLSVDQLAERAGLSTRQFSRRFKATYNMSPAAYLKRLRLDGSRTYLTQGNTVSQAAHAAGFRSDDGYRRAFESTYGVSPAQYRQRFASKEQGL